MPLNIHCIVKDAANSYDCWIEKPVEDEMSWPLNDSIRRHRPATTMLEVKASNAWSEFQS